jgi:hypothetical protein
MEQGNGLWNNIRDVDSKDSRDDDGVEGLRTGKVQHAINDAECHGEEGGADREFKLGRDMVPVVRVWKPALDSIVSFK